MLSVFFTTALSICIAEMGDKTQFLVMGFTAKYRLRDIALGVTASVMALTVISVLLGSLISSIIPMELLGLLAGVFFLGFAAASVSNGKDEDEVKPSGRRMPAAVAVFIAFFLAELGDKTQLSAIVFSARNPGAALAVFLGVVTGLIVGDAVGVAAGLILKKRLPEHVFKKLAFAVFTIFGFVTLYEPLIHYVGESAAWIALASVAAVYAGAIFAIMKRKSHN